MSNVIHHLCELSGLRDRDLLDTGLVGAMRDLLQPREVGIYRCVGDAGAQRWMMRACLGASDVVARTDPAWADFNTLPPIEAYPHRSQCLRQRVEHSAQAGDEVLSLFPLVAQGDAEGVLEVRTGCALDAEHRGLVNGVLSVYRNLHGLLDYSERDTLTGLLNRKSFDAAFFKTSMPPTAVPASEGTDRRDEVLASCWLGIVDVDHFKRVNDGFGHLIGDEVLLLLSQVMRRCLRFSDQIYRFGGEEFVLLLRCRDEVAALTTLERLRAAVQSYPMPQVGGVTISVGFTEVRQGETPVAAFERADVAVYRAKECGRNRVLSHGQLVRDGHVASSESKVNEIELF